MINALPSPEILAQILENLNMEHNMASRLAVFRNAIYPKLAILIRAHEKPIRFIEWCKFKVYKVSYHD